jgi:hypothetical protein
MHRVGGDLVPLREDLPNLAGTMIGGITGQRHSSHHLERRLDSVRGQHLEQGFGALQVGSRLCFGSKDAVLRAKRQAK